MDILIFGGTTEGRELAEALAAAGWSVTLSVATDYGAALAPRLPGLAVSARRLERGDMTALMASRPFAWVVDATHPYAAAVTENIRAAARAVGLPYRRLLRPAQAEGEGRPAIALDAVALLESGAGTLCGTTIAVTAPEELRVGRIMAREGIGEDYARARVKAQKPSAWFEERCAHTLRNDGEKASLEEQARELFKSILCKEDL